MCMMKFLYLEYMKSPENKYEHNLIKMGKIFQDNLPES